MPREIEGRCTTLSKEKKVLLVTGASSDVGSALIADISHRYDAIWAHYCSSPGKIEEMQISHGWKILPVKANFSSEESTAGMIRQIMESGRIPDHIVHLSALKTVNKKFPKFTWKDYQNGIDTSLRSIVMIAEAFLPQMAKQHYGRIVFMLTSYLLGVPPKFQSPYITVKYAQYGLMKNLAAEYADKGITVNAVSPDMIETKFLADIPELVIEQNAVRSPLKRNLGTGDVIPAFRYLLSDEAEAVTGQNLGVTGGGR